MPSRSPSRGASRDGRSETPRSASRGGRSETPYRGARSQSRSPARDSEPPRVRPWQDPNDGRDTGRTYTRSRSPVRRDRSRTPVNRGRAYSGSPMRRSRSMTPVNRGRAHSPSPSMNPGKIVVEKLTKNVNEDHLREIFGVYGPIKEIDMPMNPAFRINRGVAFILYHEVADAEKAIVGMHTGQLDGAVLNVSVVLPQRRFSHSPPPSRRLATHMDRVDRSGPDFRRPPPASGGRWRSPPGRRGASPPRRYNRPPRDDYGSYRPRSYSRSRSPPPRRRSYSRSYSRSISRSPPPRRDYRSRDSPPPGGPSGGGRRRRSLTPSSYDSYSDRSRSRDRGGRSRR